MIIRAIAFLFILLISACSGGVNFNGVSYGSLDEAVAAIRADNAALVAKIYRRDQPVAGPARIFRPSGDYLSEWLYANTYFPRCVVGFCMSASEIRREFKIRAAGVYENHLSTAHSIERSNLFQSVSIETYEALSDLPLSDPDGFMIVIGPTRGEEPGLFWSLRTPGALAPEWLPDFDQTIEPRDRRTNAWIDKLEECLVSLGPCRRDQGRLDEESLLKRALANTEKDMGPEHPAVAIDLNNLALFYQHQGRYIEAEPLYKRALAIDEKILGPDHPVVAIDLNNLALLYFAQGRRTEGAQFYERSIAMGQMYRMPKQLNVYRSIQQAEFLYAQDRNAEAGRLLERVLELLETRFGPDQPDVAQRLENYAAMLRESGRSRAAAIMEVRAKAIRARHAQANPVE